MTSARSRRGLATVGALVAWLGLAGLGAGCAGSGLGAPCGRHTDCAPGLECSVLLTCAVPVSEEDAGVEGAPTDDGNRIPPGPEAGYEDAAVDAPADAPTDAPTDAPAVDAI